MRATWRDQASLAHDFAITSSGHYRVFVQNRSSVQINAAGSYYFN
ncbi:MAG: hypothetical protein V8T24_08930 [Roseburia hominis]